MNVVDDVVVDYNVVCDNFVMNGCVFVNGQQVCMDIIINLIFDLDVIGGFYVVGDVQVC